MADIDRPRPGKPSARRPSTSRPSTSRDVPRTPDAVDIALDHVDDDDAARALLTKHTELLKAQIASERLDHGAKRMAIVARLLIAVAALVVAGGLTWMILDARADRGLVIEAFATPSDLVTRGLTGEVIAGNLADRLGEIDRAASSFRSPETMSVNWGDDVKIEIPSTGVSIGELDRFLHDKLGHQTVIGGSVFRTPEGLRMTVRTGALGTVEQTGKDPDLETMIRKAAEGVFEKTQPYRYSKYLEFAGRTDEAMAVARRLAEGSSDPKERAWAWAQISNLLDNAGNVAAAAEAGKRAVAEDPSNPLAYLNTSIALAQLSHGREAAFYGAKASELGSDPQGGLSEVGVNTSRLNHATGLARSGDFQQALKAIDAVSGPLYGGVREQSLGGRASLLLAIHDISGSRATVALPPDTYFASHFTTGGGVPLPQHSAALAMEDWAGALSDIDQVIAAATSPQANNKAVAVELQRTLLPLRAVDLALNGRLPEAQALAAGLPTDCGACDAARMGVAALAGDYRSAFRWLGEVRRWSSDSPFPETALAQVLERQGHHAAALQLADQALAIGPKYPDALKVRGDALRKLNRVDEAVDSYAKAAKGAPRWGRLQVDWGFAEMRLGHWKQARSHLAAAATMDLNPADRRLLVKLQGIASRR